MKKTRVLVVDDELSIIKFLRANLTDNGYEVSTAINGAEAIEVFEKEPPDLVLMDIMMPGMDGFELCRRLREWSAVPIVMLSAKWEEKDKVKCLDTGADDYITKPFGTGELMARIRALLRRTETAPSEPTRSSFATGDLQIDFSRRQVTAAGREIRLTPTEYNLLKEMVINANKVLTHSMLLGKLWGPEYGSEKEYLRVFIGRLRKELEPKPENPRYIITVPGVGYKFNTEE